MPVKKLELQLYTLPKCDNQISTLYDPKNKVFISPNYNHTVSAEPLTDRMDRVLRSSKGDSLDELALLMQIPDFKKLYKEIVSEGKKTFKKGDVVYRLSHKGKPVFMKVNKHMGWQLVESCNAETLESEKDIVALWQFVDIKSGYMETTTETTYQPISKFEEWEEGKKAVFAIRKAMKTEKIFGAHIVYAGKVYNI